MGNFRQHVNRKRKERERKRNRRNAKLKSKEESDSMKNIAKALRKTLVISPSDHPRQNLAENAVSHDCHHIRSAAISCAKYCFGENTECFNKMDSPVSYDEIMDTPERPSKGRSPSSKTAMEDGDSSPRGRRFVKRKTNRRRVKEEIDRIEQEQYRRFIGIHTGLRRESSDGEDPDSQSKEEEEDEDEEIDVVGIYPRSVPPVHVNKALQKMRVAQFRIINEMLYTTQSEKAAELFCEDRKNFDVYHEGYRHQVAKWLLNPLDKIISVIQESFPPTTKIADLGCGEAKLAVTLKPLGYTVHSFDLVATNEHVQECNIRDVPLQAESVDVAVMCLSLMGTDMGQFVLEANRILVANGELIIAEVESRLPSDDSFEKMMKRYGFALKCKDTARIFHFFGFRKAKPVPKGAEKNMDTVLSLKPCLYKKR